MRTQTQCNTQHSVYAEEEEVEEKKHNLYSTNKLYIKIVIQQV